MQNTNKLQDKNYANLVCAVFPLLHYCAQTTRLFPIKRKSSTHTKNTQNALLFFLLAVIIIVAHLHIHQMVDENGVLIVEKALL